MERARIDVTPGAHSFLDALGSVSFKLGCGCTIAPSSTMNPSPVVELRSAGNSYPCNKHGEQIITRATTRLVGWQATPAGRMRP